MTDEEFGGDMGTPWVVNVKNRDVLVCSKGCVAMVPREPEKYLPEGRKWATVIDRTTD